MNTHDSTGEAPPGTESLNNSSRGFFRNLKIGSKLTLGFAALVAITFLIAGSSYLGSSRATINIDRTGEVRVPTALASSRAQADLLIMLGNVRGYLALGDKQFLKNYLRSREVFEEDLSKLEKLSPNFDQKNRDRLNELMTAFKQWADLPERLFALHDDQLEREPAYRLLATKGSRWGGLVLIGIQSLIEAQAQSVPTSQGFALLKDMSNFQGSFAAMLSGLRGYTTTRNRIYRQEYEVNLTLNQMAWDRLFGARSGLIQSQQTILDEIADNRQNFLLLPDKMFEILEGDRYREDLYLFRIETIPVTEKMQRLLSEITEDQQTMLQTDLNRGRTGLALANRVILVGGVVALLSCIVLAYLTSRNIAGPVRRLTQVAERIREGDLEARASVESGDEIGILAETFNNMTTQLRQTLLQVRLEKKRADDLLNVVIPIGARLSSEKDFNHLLESILVEAKSFCHADAGTLYLRTEEDQLKFVIVRNDSHGIAFGGATGKEASLPSLALHDARTGEPNHRQAVAWVALNGVSLNLPDVRESGEFDPLCCRLQEDEGGSYEVTSLLAIPLKNSLGEVLGVMQLTDAKEPETDRIIAFDKNLQQLMESFSLLAAAALEAYIREQSLKQEIRQLKIEIDEVKRQKQVSEIVDSDFFQDLQAKARSMRKRGGPTKQDS